MRQTFPERKSSTIAQGESAGTPLALPLFGVKFGQI